MTHRQLFPLFQHIVKNLPVKMETLVGLSSSYALHTEGVPSNPVCRPYAGKKPWQGRGCALIPAPDGQGGLAAEILNIRHGGGGDPQGAVAPGAEQLHGAVVDLDPEVPAAAGA